MTEDDADRPHAEAAPAGDPAPAARPSPWARFLDLFRTKGWKRVTAIVTTFVTVVGLVTGIISVIPILTRDATGLSSLEAELTPFAESTSEFALPEAALDGSFPIAAEPCGAEQLAWLDEHGEPLQRRFLLDMRNVAGEGGVLALTELRAEGERTPAEAAVYRVVCEDPAASGVMRSARLDTDSTESRAVFVGVGGSSSADVVADVPVGWNLMPGETGKLVVDLYGADDFAGDLAVTLHSGRESSAAVISGDEIRLPGLWQAGTSYLVPGEAGWECRRVAGGVVVPCELPFE